MNKIEQYKERFYNLMESKVGDVRPLISEASKIIKATTTPERMYNFPNAASKNSNSNFGLKGDNSKENFYFKTTLSDIINRSTGSTNSFLSGFIPATDAGKYVNYVRFGTNELSGDGSIQFDLKTLPDNTEVMATHNGLLLVRRMMDQLQGGKNGTVILTIGAEKRESSQENYDVKKIQEKLVPGFNGISTNLSVLFTPENLRPSIKESYAKQWFANKSEEELKSTLKKQIKKGLVNIFLTPEEISQSDAIIAEKGLTTEMDISDFEPFFGKGNVRQDINAVWINFQTQMKNTMIENFRLYLPDEFKYLANNLSKLITNIFGESLYSTYKGLDKETVLGQLNPLESNKRSESSKTYEIGK
jgi:hypothetical protein